MIRSLLGYPRYVCWFGRLTSSHTFLQVYFTWVIRDYGTAEWFHSLLHAIEEQDTQNRIEINIYLTAKIKEDDMNNIIVCIEPRDDTVA